MRIYTRSKKPKLYSILALTAVFAVSLVLLLVLFKSAGDFALGNISVLFTLYFLLVLVILVVSLIRQLKYNPYSYNTVYYFSFSLFVLALVLSFANASYMSLSGLGTFLPSDAALLILNSARFYIKLSAPFLAVFSLALAVSNVFLIKREGVRFKNILGIILSLLIVSGEAFLFVFDGKFTGRWSLVIDVFCAIFLYFECMLIGTIFADVVTAVHTPEFDKDYVIILGCRVARNSEPTPLLASRIDKAYQFASLQKERTGVMPRFIASGGKGNDEPISEAECIKNRLVSNGVPEDQIVIEDKSTDTLENMKFSMEKVGFEGKFAFSTAGYHVFRSGIAANRAKKRVAEGVGAKTKWYFWPNAAVREFIGLLTEHRGKQAAVLLGLIAAYTALALIVK